MHDRHRVTVRRRIIRVFCCSSLLLAGAATVAAQAIDDPAIAPGTPATSYALSNLDHVNYYTGSVNVTIPVLTIGGRGSASRTIDVPIQRQWGVSTSDQGSAPSTALWNYMGGFYTSGTIGFQTASPNPTFCYNAADNAYYGSQATSYLTWVTYGGTQTVLTDTQFNGQPKDPDASCQPANRGRVFRSTDGTDLTFIAASDVYDGGAVNAGTLITRDGTKFSFSTPANYITQIEDRNGNQIQFAFQVTASGGIYTVSDPLGRQETINFTEDLDHDTQDVITYPGFNGQTRTIAINYSQLHNVLAGGESLRTYHELFPELNGSSSTQFDPFVFSSIVLANGRSYSMQYNSYGELVKLTLPTGGYYTYRYSEAYASGSSGAYAITGGGYGISRPLLERDEYADGVNLSAKMVYSVPQRASGLDGAHPTRAGIEARASFQDGAGHVLRQEDHYFYGNPASGDAPPPANTYADWWLGLEFQTDSTDGTNALQSAKRVFMQRPWATDETDQWFTPTDDAVPAHDPQLCQVNTTLDGSVTGAVVYGYDRYNNISDAWEFGFGSAPAIAAGCPASNGHYRHTQNVFRTDAQFLNPNVNLLSLPYTTKVYDAAGQQVAYTLLQYDEVDDAHSLHDAPGIGNHDAAYGTGNNVRGNATSLWQAEDGLNLSALTQYNYDIAGNVVSVSDPNRHLTQYNFNYDGSNRYAFATQATNALGQTTSAVYDYNIAKPTSTVDLNGVTTTYAYNDADRLTQMVRAQGTSLENQINVTYSTDSRDVNVYQDQNTNGDRALRSETLYDGLGRQTDSRTYESGSQYIATGTSYDGLGRTYSVTNPYRMGEAVQSTIYGYNALGRTTSVQNADGATATTSYSGAYSTATDESGHAKQYQYDSLGRLLAVVEDPGSGHLSYGTTYSYDTLDDLITVQQGGQTRSFSYDGVKRLKTAANPESGTTSYDYYANGNLHHRTDARSIVTTYTYDALDRLTQKAYSQSGATVSYSYDAAGVANSAGHVTQTQAANGTAMNYTGFDALGRVTASSQATGGATYPFVYGYDLADALTSETYPSGRVLTMTYDVAGRTSQVAGALSGNTTTYVSNLSYAAQGAPSQYKYGNNVWRQAAYNNRLQPDTVADQLNNSPSNVLLKLTFGWGGTSNNGNVLGLNEEYGGASGFNQTFGYDALNRLQTASDTGGWARTFQYDRYGNMWTDPAYTGPPPGGATSNVYNSANQANGGTYDAAGNVLLFGASAITYDAENRQVTVTDPPGLGSGTETYLYDGLGQRVEKSGPGGATVYVYDALGQLVAEYSTASVTAPCATCYLSADQLGSTRLVTDGSGAVIGRHDFYPFGEEIAGNTAGRSNAWGSGTDNVYQRFTGQERDQETGLDFFRARYLSAAQGRFTSPDPANAGADLTNPQSWNGYAYVLGNPLGLVDPTGTETAIYQYGNCYIYTYDWSYTDSNGVYTVTNSTGTFGDCSGSGSSSFGGNSQIFQPPPPRIAESQASAPPKSETQQPGPSICAGYGTVCFPTTAPKLQPVNWKKFTMYLSCLAGTPPALMAAASGSPQDVTDSTPETQGRTTVWGYTPGKQKNGGQRPLNPSSAPEVGEAAANAPSYLNNVLACSAVVANKK